MELMTIIEAAAITLDSDLWQKHGEDCRAAYPLTESEGLSQMLLSPLPPHVRQA